MLNIEVVLFQISLYASHLHTCISHGVFDDHEKPVTIEQVGGKKRIIISLIVWFESALLALTLHFD